MAKKPESDKQLIESIKKGNKDAFNLLVIKYQQKIFGLIGSYVKDIHEVQDVAQEVFIKAYRALANFRGDSAFYTWLYRIAINTAKNHIITKSRKTPNVDIDIEDAQYFDVKSLQDTDNPENLMAKDRMEKAIFEIFNSLPDGLKTTIQLREIEGFSYEEISAIMDCPVGTVRSRIFRAREIIDQSLEVFMKTDN